MEVIFLTQELGANLTTNQVIALRDQLDEDGSGTISLREFLQSAKWEVALHHKCVLKTDT